jgi:hypothetical protein
MEGAEVPIEIIEPLVMTDGGTPIKTPARNSIPRTRKLSTAAAESEKPAQAPAPPDDARHRPSTANAPVTRAESTVGHPVKRATRYSAPTNQLSKTRRCRDGRGENCAGVDPICPYATLPRSFVGASSTAAQLLARARLAQRQPSPSRLTLAEHSADTVLTPRSISELTHCKSR